MNSESNLIKQIESQLVRLGYEVSAIKNNFKTSIGSIIDLLILEYGKPKVAIEIKSGSSFPQSLDPVELKFHPSVRIAQRLSKEVGAEYYAVANSECILWFETDQSGRPKLLTRPILPKSDYRDTRQAAFENYKEPIARTLFSLLDLHPRISDPYKLTLYTSIVIYACVLNELGDTTLVKALIHPDAYSNTLQLFKSEIKLTESLDEASMFFPQAINILSQTSFIEAPPSDFLASFDEFLLLRNHLDSFKLPRWLNDLFVQLADIDTEDEVLDIFSNFGDVAAAVAISNHKVQVISIVNHPINYLWARIQQLILDSNAQNQVLFGEMPPNNLRHFSNLSKPSKIIVAPPFNVKLPFTDQRGELSEDRYLSLAIDWVTEGGRIVAIVPEGFLFSHGSKKRELRQKILAHTSIRAIFGLDMFMLNTSVKASILVLDKLSLRSLDNVIMGRIHQIDVPVNTRNITSCLQIPRIAQLLEAFHLQDRNLVKTANAWLVQSSKLVSDNWTVDQYSPFKQVGALSTYTTVPLSDVAEIFKGSPLTLDENGDLLVLGPAAVRKLSIDVTKFDRTSISKLPKNCVVTRSNDIVVNALSNYRGQAALIEQELAGYYVSRNIIIVRSKSSQLLPAYLEIALNSKFVELQLLERTTGSVIRQITKNAMLDVQVPVPSLEKQKQIISQVRSAYDEILVSQQILNENQDRLDQAEKSLNAMLENLHSGGTLQ